MQYIANSKAERLAYRYQAGEPLTMVFLGGFRSDMQGTKALHFEALAKSLGLASLCFDYSGHGQSQGEFAAKTIEDWLEDALLLIDRVTSGPLLLVGSSMGGWLSLHLALRRSERVVGFLGIASAPDFVSRLIWARMEAEHKAALAADGRLYIAEMDLTLSEAFFQAGHTHCLLDEELNIECPLHLVHGLQDELVPWQFSLEIVEKARSAACNLTLIKNGCHRLASDEALAHLSAVFKQLLQVIQIENVRTEPLLTA